MEKTATTKTPIVLAVVFTLVGLVLFAVFILLAGYGREGQEDDYEEQRARERLAIRQELMEADLKKLGTVGWVNEKQEVAHVPIEWGMQRAMAQLSDKPISASDVAVPPPMPAQPPQVETAEAEGEEAATDAAPAAGESATDEAAAPEDVAEETNTETPAQEEATAESAQ